MTKWTHRPNDKSEKTDGDTEATAKTLNQSWRWSDPLSQNLRNYQPSTEQCQSKGWSNKIRPGTSRQQTGIGRRRLALRRKNRGRSLSWGSAKRPMLESTAPSRHHEPARIATMSTCKIELKPHSMLDLKATVTGSVVESNEEFMLAKE